MKLTNLLFKIFTGGEDLDRLKIIVKEEISYYLFEEKQKRLITGMNPITPE